MKKSTASLGGIYYQLEFKNKLVSKRFVLRQQVAESPKLVLYSRAARQKALPARTPTHFLVVHLISAECEIIDQNAAVVAVRHFF